jgi:hypothetical protein
MIRLPRQSTSEQECVSREFGKGATLYCGLSLLVCFTSMLGICTAVQHVVTVHGGVVIDPPLARVPSLLDTLAVCLVVTPPLPCFVGWCCDSPYFGWTLAPDSSTTQLLSACPGACSNPRQEGASTLCVALAHQPGWATVGLAGSWKRGTCWYIWAKQGHTCVRRQPRGNVRRCYKGYASSYAATELSIGRDATRTGRGLGQQALVHCHACWVAGLWWGYAFWG